MAVIDPKQFAEDQREQDLDAAFSNKAESPEGFTFVRRVSALTIDILRRANNFFVTAEKGYKAIGISSKEFAESVSPRLQNGKENPKFDPEKLILAVPKVVEVIVLLTCSEDELDACDDDLANLHKLRREMMKKHSVESILLSLPSVQSEFFKINRSTAVVPNDKTSSVVGETKKKLSRVSGPGM